MKKLLFLIGLPIFIFSCNPVADDDNGDNYNVYEGQYITYTVDGTTFNATNDSVIGVVTNFSSPMISGDGIDQARLIQLYMGYPITTQDSSMNIIHFSSGASAFFRFMYGELYQSISGNITVHRETSSRPNVSEEFTGTFYGNAIQLISSSPDTIHITSGSFKMYRLL